MLKKKLRGKSKFLRKMNELMEIYSRNQDTAFAYRELLGLEPLIKYEGERAMFDLNRASLLYDMERYREAEKGEKERIFRPSIRRLMRCANPCGLKF